MNSRLAERPQEDVSPVSLLRYATGHATANSPLRYLRTARKRDKPRFPLSDTRKTRSPFPSPNNEREFRRVPGLKPENWNACHGMGQTTTFRQPPDLHLNPENVVPNLPIGRDQ